MVKPLYVIPRPCSRGLIQNCIFVEVYCVYDNNKFCLWYVAGSDWIDINGKLIQVYDVGIESMMEKLA